MDFDWKTRRSPGGGVQRPHSSEPTARMRLPCETWFDVGWVVSQSLVVKQLILLLPMLLAGCVSRPPVAEEVLVSGDPGAPSQVTPVEAMAIAGRLSTHPWRPFARNMLHGRDASGIVVNTPDLGHEPDQPRKGWWVPGVVNEGVPYKWGGFDDTVSFDAAVEKGQAAGDVSSPAKRRADNAAVSRHAAGVDCSGFVSRCLKLPTVHDTAKLPSVCDELSDAKQLRPGDLLNIPRRHVVLCAGWSNPEKTWIYYYETGGGPQYWKPGLKQAPLAALLDLGYKPLRYRGMAHPSVKPGESAKEVISRSVKATADIVPNPTVGEP
jgi:hypothetical protein